jgi:hypothetical protein
LTSANARTKIRALCVRGMSRDGLSHVATSTTTATRPPTRRCWSAVGCFDRPPTSARVRSCSDSAASRSATV